ncbi:MAG: sel1 repeat family protein, partial [Asticcacaulis sp.]|nr:sel1 repeat family protein [Asticcacaulis sp.]
AGSEFDADRPSANAYTLQIALPDEAVEACQKASQVKPGDRHVAYDLGRAYLSAGDFTNAHSWFEQSATAGNAAAMLELGRLYSKGNGVALDLTQMVSWYQKSADAGDPEAMTALGILYDSGWGVDEDKKQARKWYKAAADRGDPGGKGLLEMMN